MSLPDEPNINALWGHLIVEELIRNGIDQFVVAPGSRSTPLVQAIARNPRAQPHLWIDERGAGFFALGHARATGRPAVVVTTSGTAVANLLPAVVEASLDAVPLILLTADRPHELREVGANQSVRQTGMFSEHVRWSFDMPAPDDRLPARMVLTTIDHAVARAEGAWHGPVQLNCPFREPLAPVPSPWDAGCLRGLETWRKNERPFTEHHEYTDGHMRPEDCGLDALADDLRGRRDVLVVAGRMSGWTVPDPRVRHFARERGWPLYADLRSGFRLGDRDAQARTPNLDRLLEGSRPEGAPPPRSVIQFGARLTSKRMQTWLESGTCERYIVVDRCPTRLDPGHVVSHRYEMDPVHFCETLGEALGEAGTVTVDAGWVHGAAAIQDAIETWLEAEDDLSEAWVARWLSRHMIADSGLFVSSSMPIRDLQEYGCADGPWLRVDANRGASGIDGVVSTAAGFASGLGRPTTLLIGDLALLHDVNALAMLRDRREALTIVVVNNGGGGIFSFLPVSDFDDVLTPLINTPHALRFEGVTFSCGLPYTRVHTRDAFASAYRDAQKMKRTSVIEVTSRIDTNVRDHRALEAAIGRALSEPR
jgi:2-succinyl-5-enolpyruvyl-6-hydroxy-3-cyclohexene-1-carboxylate synthase